VGEGPPACWPGDEGGACDRKADCGCERGLGGMAMATPVLPRCFSVYMGLLGSVPRAWNSR
jgi:hypothetical protein